MTYIIDMVRTQIYIPDDQYNELKLLAAVGEGRFSDLIREGIGEVIKKRKVIKTNKLDPWKDFVGACKTNFGGKSGQELINDYYENDVV